MTPRQLGDLLSTANFQLSGKPAHQPTIQLDNEPKPHGISLLAGCHTTETISKVELKSLHPIFP